MYSNNTIQGRRDEPVPITQLWSDEVTNVLIVGLIMKEESPAADIVNRDLGEDISVSSAAGRAQLTCPLASPMYIRFWLGAIADAVISEVLISFTVRKGLPVSMNEDANVPVAADQKRKFRPERVIKLVSFLQYSTLATCRKSRAKVVGSEQYRQLVSDIRVKDAVIQVAATEGLGK
ncbi:hypothetical protein Pmar_PMAR010135 [Perkinsus marinus ATCC 50983]|uniref:Uncharacterized protein n=1 Tax=Perkinsus marinus (strain ATCC 50983 / TXsc) TaxID=423536 RepID=C5K4X9_PERM5|nr:hypothetical protein Pmar_PMAR010135 [Perkinsus marinus ATCC 50983]EER20401.1 hypothetical protein Pmar_PMAR010135 [Perkinsus marinus ATCC 50983]|eukprot:XP_002788605.1 hypothetical protein Pmar_PMAR010135 [Perkinsus marinus ATCC 50983]